MRDGRGCKRSLARNVGDPVALCESVGCNVGWLCPLRYGWMRQPVGWSSSALLLWPMGDVGRSWPGPQHRMERITSWLLSADGCWGNGAGHVWHSLQTVAGP